MPILDFLGLSLFST